MIDSKRTLKVLGFVFDDNASVKEHVKCMVKKFNNTVWSVIHLKKAKLEKSKIVRAYCSMMRPVIEYASNVYGPMLTNAEKEKIENCQKRVLRIIYGYQNTYEDLINAANIKTLEERRENMFEKFAIKMSKSERFSRKWLPKRENERENLRDSKKYIEFYARTDRMYNSPLFKMRRILNQI